MTIVWVLVVLACNVLDVELGRVAGMDDVVLNPKEDREAVKLLAQIVRADYMIVAVKAGKRRVFCSGSLASNSS